MLRISLFILMIALPQLFVAQKPFVGSLEYNLVSVDLISKDTLKGKLFIYALDSMVRNNYLMADGKMQESIHHLNRQKLLSLIEIDNLFFAVQIKDTIPNNFEFQYKKTRHKKQIQGLKCKEVRVVFSKGQTLLFYAKNIDARYFVGLNNAPGLPIKGQIPTANGYMAFELQKLDNKTPPLQLFIPDKKYKVLPLDAFLEWTETQNSTEPKD